MTKLLYSAVFITVATCLLACSDSSTSSGGGNFFGSVPLKAGSTFTFEQINYDSLGRVKDTMISVDSITEIGSTHLGKTNVIHVIKLSEGYPVGERFLNIEASGDISEDLFANGGIITPSTNWVTYPTVSNQKIIVKLYDTTLTSGGITMQTAAYDTLSPAGTITVSIRDSLLLASRVRQGVYFRRVISGVTESFSGELFFSFSSAIGYLVREEEGPMETPGLGRSGGNTRTLIGFRLR